jgi:D-alanyl-D-alanine carboxypeptidase (penicillin-binding protein 5/6)
MNSCKKTTFNWGQTPIKWFAFATLWCWTVWADGQVLAAPEVAARAYVLMDVSAAQVLVEQRADEPIEPASLTKLMTAFVVFDALRAQKITLQQTMQVSERAWKMPGARMFIDTKMQVPVEDLLKGLIVQSANDAAMALAEGVAGNAEHFVILMNQQAKALGLTHTTFKNPEGLAEPGHVSTARDLATLAHNLWYQFPDRMALFAIKKYHFAGTPAANDTSRNLLLFRDPTVNGMQTGYTPQAGYCMVASATRDTPSLKGRRMLAVVLGMANENIRSQESQKLLNWGFAEYEAIKLFEARQTVASVPVWKGMDNMVPLGRPEPVVVAVPTGQAKRLRSELQRPEPLVAPLSLGQPVGRMKIYLDHQLLTEKPLVALKQVDESGVVGRAWDALRLWIK